jgi:hypothetical protein
MITERLMKLGAWSVTFAGADATALGRFDHIVITRQRVDPRTLDNAGMLAVASHTGIITKVSTDPGDLVTVSGPGIEAWLGDAEDKGFIYETARVYDADTFVNVLDRSTSVYGLLRDDTGATTSIVAGTLTALAGTYTGQHHFESQRTAIRYVCDYYGAEYRVNPDATLDAGLASDLFVTTPTTVIVASDAGSDPNYEGVEGMLSTDDDVDDYTTRVLLLAEGTGDAIVEGSADAVSVPYNDLLGNEVVRTRIVNEGQTNSTNADTRAAYHLDQFAGSRQAVTLKSDGYEVDGSFAVGDTVYVFDPVQGLADATNEVTFRGRTINPAAIRVVGISWPVTEGMGVYHRDLNGVWADLTDLAVFETGATTLDVGEPPKPVTQNLVPHLNVARQLKQLETRSLDNLISNPGFEADSVGGSLDPHLYDDGSGGAWAGWTGRSGARSARFDANTQSAGATVTFGGKPNLYDHSACTEGDTFYFEGWARYIDTVPTVQPSLVSAYYDETNTYISQTISTWPTLTTSFVKHTSESTAPAGAAFVVFFVRILSGNGSTVAILLDDFYARRQVDTFVLSSQAVDISRTLEPVHSDTLHAETSTYTITTTPTDIVTGTFTIPSWVGVADLLTTHSIGIANSSNVQTISLVSKLGGATGNGANQTVPVSTSESVMCGGRKTVVAPGSTLTVITRGSVNVSSITNTEADAHAILVGAR